MVECLRFADVGDVPQGVETEGIGVKTHGVTHLVGQLFGVHAENLRGIRTHRRVHIHGYMRQAPVVVELVEHINDLLRTADGERGDEELAFAINAGVVHNAQELLFGHQILIVEAVTVGRFADEVVALREELRRWQNMTMLATDIAGVG